MAKYSFQDVIPPNRKKKITKDIEIPVRSASTSTPITPRSSRKTSSPSRAVWMLAATALFIIVAGYFIFFSEGAKIEISLKTDSIPVSISAASSSLPYQALAAEKEGSVEVNTSGEPVQVDKKATGTIIIYNNYSSAPQTLIATTRFETPGGLVYLLDKQVTVPGTKVSGGKTIPGSIEATVTATSSGEKYNISQTDFTIPGFKGTTKYDAFYGRSKTAMTGGFSGMMAQVSDSDLKSANDSLQASLLDKALEDIRGQLPAGFIFFKDGGIRTSYTSNISSGDNGKATVKGKITVSAAAFNRADIEGLIVSELGQQYHFDNLDSLKLSLRNTSTVNSFISNPALLVDLSGTLTIGQSFNPEDLQKSLAGKAKVQLPEILKLYPEITKAEAVVRPFWKKSFPENYKNIHISITK